MNIARILVVQEDAGAPRELRLVVQERPVEFEFRPPAHVAGGETDLADYRAIAASTMRWMKSLYSIPAFAAALAMSCP